jgi:hypothetical protein
MPVLSRLQQLPPRLLCVFQLAPRLNFALLLLLGFRTLAAEAAKLAVFQCASIRRSHILRWLL